MSNLKHKVIKLAYKNPKLRPYLLPLVSDKKAFCSKTAGSWKVDVNRTSLEKAREFAQMKFEQAGTSLDEVWPNFDKNYTLLKKKLGKAKSIPRKLMPVIEPEDMDEFQKRLEEGHLDIFKPWALGQKWTPSNFSGKGEADKWVTLGLEDGEERDDRVRAKWTKVPAGDLLPTQDQIWFDKLVKGAIDFGPVTGGSPVLKMTIIVSKEGYILDGHHRFSGTLLSDPSLGMKALYIPLGIDKLLEVGRAYGASQGNKPKH